MTRKRAVTAEVPDHEPICGATYLPRKFKIGFAFPGDNCGDVYTHDIGVMPVLDGDSLRAFTVLVGGGQGKNHTNPDTFPRLADPLATLATDKSAGLACWSALVLVPRRAIAEHAGAEDRSKRRGDTDEQDQRQQVRRPSEHPHCDAGDPKNDGGRLYPCSSGTVPRDPGLRRRHRGSGSKPGPAIRPECARCGSGSNDPQDDRTHDWHHAQWRRDANRRPIDGQYIPGWVHDEDGSSSGTVTRPPSRTCLSAQSLAVFGHQGAEKQRQARTGQEILLCSVN